MIHPVADTATSSRIGLLVSIIHCWLGGSLVIVRVLIVVFFSHARPRQPPARLRVHLALARIAEHLSYVSLSSASDDVGELLLRGVLRHLAHNLFRDKERSELGELRFRGIYVVYLPL